MRCRAACAAAGVLAAALAQPAIAAKASATAHVTTVRSLSVSKTRDLDFGVLVAGAGGTVTLDPETGARTAAGVVVRGSAATARFVGAGTPGRYVAISYPAAAVSLKQTEGSATMAIEQVTINAGTNIAAGFQARVIPPGGLIEVLIGGRLRVGANQAAGDYAATFNVTINYY